jgi:HSP20 family molecular chaperone IbpA
MKLFVDFAVVTAVIKMPTTKIPTIICI